MRTKVDLKTKKSYREIVDGQQRLRAITDFAKDKFALMQRANEFAGLKYSSMDDEQQEIFLSYTIGVEQLVNASDEDVLEVFSRLNSYTVSLNHPEKRHANYQSDFKWAVHENTKIWAKMWKDCKVLTTRQCFRMQDDSLMAEMFGIILQGVTDGGQLKITKLYDAYDKNFAEKTETTEKVNNTLKYVEDNFVDILIDRPLASAPHFLMLFAATAHALFGIPDGNMEDDMPTRDDRALSDLTIAKDNLAIIADTIETEEPETPMRDFWRVSSRSTQRIASRRVRFPTYYRALLPESLL
jgi:hypothetical protein